MVDTNDLSASELEFALKLANDPVFFMENILRNPENPDKNFSFHENGDKREYQAAIVMFRPVLDYIDKDGKPIYKNRSKILRMGRRCLVGNTKILLLNNIEKEIQDIKIGDIVLSRDSNGEKVYRKVTDFFKNGIKPVFKITLLNGMYLECTSNHPILTSNNENFIWKSKESGLSIGDQVVINDSTLFNTSIVESINYIGMINTYDISVEIDHNFIANGIVTHNTGKCITGESHILQSDGTLKTIEEMFKEQKGSCLSLDLKTMKLVKSNNVIITESGKQEVIRLTLESGKIIKATANHPFLTKETWEELQDLKEGDYIYTVNNLDKINNKDISLNELYEYIEQFLRFRYIKEKIFLLSPKQLKIFIKEICVCENNEHLIKCDLLDTFKIAYLLEFLGVKFNVEKKKRNSYIYISSKEFKKNLESNNSIKNLINVFKKYKTVHLERIVSKEHIGIEQTYDIHVPEYHNFIANGIVVHNSTIMAAEAVYLAATKPRHRIIFISPFEAQCESFFAIIDKLITGSSIIPKHQSKRPYKIEFENGSFIKAFTANTKSGSKGSTIRGQEGDHICFPKETNIKITQNVAGNIENLKIRQDILGFDQKPYQGSIQKILFNENKELIQIETPLQTIKCTPEHPFTFDGKEVPAKDTQFIYTEQSYRYMSFEKSLVEARLMGFIINDFQVIDEKVVFECGNCNYEQIMYDLGFLGDTPELCVYADRTVIKSKLIFKLFIKEKMNKYTGYNFFLNLEAIIGMIKGNETYRKEFLSGFLSRTSSLFTISRIGNNISPFLIYFNLKIKQKRYNMLKRVLNMSGINESYTFLKDSEVFHYIKMSTKASKLISEVGTCYNRENQKRINRYKLGLYMFKDKFNGVTRYKSAIDTFLNDISIFNNEYFILPVIKKTILNEKENVYNITTDNFACHRYHANGCVVHNCIDEMDFGMDSVIDEVVLPIYTGNPKATITAASTPSGRRGTFYKWNQKPEMIQGKVFHIPSQSSPKWNEQAEITVKNTLTKNAYIHEILADFGEEESGVFRKTDLDLCTITTDHEHLNDYYKSLIYDPSNIYIMGVDWNKLYGVCIVVVEKNTTTGKYRVFAHEIVDKSEYTQLIGVDKIIEIHEHIARCNYIYVDEGYGETQYQILLKKAQERLDLGLKNRIVSINSGATMTYYDNIQKKMIDTRTKPYMVNNMIKIIEKNIIDIHTKESIEHGLLDQLGKYNYKKTEGTIPVYVGYDHSLDPLMLAMLGFDLNYSNTKMVPSIPIVKSIDKKITQSVKSNSSSYRESIRKKILSRGFSRGGF